MKKKFLKEVSENTLKIEIEKFIDLIKEFTMVGPRSMMKEDTISLLTINLEKN